ncbi:unnamed protein product [Sphenostylis stenocarpa]|uniref:Uncharacterized protein n=1 Tax=Sphenostylis stenocarpa TaxID=92480 RepID=A0AA86TDZ7_9FABA|nr:unnamed protein product [Sphenostylis stenocarpa]
MAFLPASMLKAFLFSFFGLCIPIWHIWKKAEKKEEGFYGKARLISSPKVRVVAEEFLICELLGIYSQEGMKGLGCHPKGLTEFHAFKDRSFNSLSRILLFPPLELVEYASRRRKASYDIRL